MKADRIFLLFLLISLIISQTACERNGGGEPDKPEIKSSYYISPTPPKGKVVLIYPTTRTFSYLGHGYDATEDYLNDASVRSSIIDLNKVPQDAIHILSMPNSGRRSFSGKNMDEFLQSINAEKVFEVPESNSKDFLFTGTILKSEIVKEPYDYSTQYTFMGDEFLVAHQRESLLIPKGNYMSRYFTDRFKEDLQELKPQELIETYGTHLLMEVYVGHRIRTLYRAVVTSPESERVHTVGEGLLARQSEIYKLAGVNITASEKESSRNYGGAIVVEFYGGDYAKLPYPELLPNELVNGPMDITAWRQSVNKDNYTLVGVSEIGLKPIPIYNLIEDPAKQIEVKKAVIQYIKSKQIQQMDTAPIIQAYNGKCHRYFTSYSDFEALPDKTYTSCGVIGSVFKRQYPETVPLYLFSNGVNDRLSLSEYSDVPKGYTLKGTFGFVYKDYASDLQTIYEITDGTHFAYTTERKDIYGSEEGQRWTPTGKEFYTKKISL